MTAEPPAGSSGGPSLIPGYKHSNDFEKEDSEKTPVSAGGSRTSLTSDTATDMMVEETEEAGGELPPPNCLDAKIDPATLPIEFRYFSYDIALPAPNTVPSHIPGSTDAAADPSALPPMPDLTPFTDPHLWPNYRKYTLLTLSCIATFLTAYAAGSFSPPTARMVAAYGVSTEIVLFAGLTVFCLGFALAPMLLAPLSEYNGRYPVFVGSGVLFVIAQVVSGLSPDIACMIVARLFVGVGGSVFSTMIGGVIADMWHAEGRNTPMTLFSGAVLLGTGCGPLISAVITYRTTYPYNRHDVATDPGVHAPWRWVFWHQIIADVVLMVALVLLFKESRGTVLLSRKARALNAWYEERERLGYVGVWMAAEGEVQDETKDETKDETTDETTDGEHAGGSGQKRPAHMHVLAEHRRRRQQLRRIRWVVKDDEDRTTVLRTISMSLYRPFHMFFTEPVVFFFSLWVAFAWAVLYLTFGSIFLVFERVYGFNTEQAGYAFSALMVGATIATAVGLYQDRVLRAVAPVWLRVRMHPSLPEARLYSACLNSVLLPAGLFLFGFTARPDCHWIVPMVGVCLSTMGIFAVYLATFNYLADVYHRFASSALAAQSCARNVLGGIFPLVMHALFTNLGNAHAGAVLGGIATALTFVPWVLVFFGETIRRRSKFAMSLA